MHCTKCGREIMLGGQKNCPNCETELSADSTFCHTCGARVNH